MRIALLVALFPFLFGCTAVPDRAPRPESVDVPIAVPCLTASDVPPRPLLLELAEILKLDDYRAVKALLVDRLERERYQRRLEATLGGCVSGLPP